MRRFLSVFLCLLICFTLSLSANAAGAEVTDLQTQIYVAGDGSCQLTMSADVRFLSSPKTFCMPLMADADDISATGAAYDVDTIDGVECVIFESSNGFSGTIHFVCSFSISRAVAQSDSGQQTFTLKLPEKGWDFPIEKYSVSIEFPAQITEQPSWYSAYHGIDIENYLDISIAQTSMTVSSFERLKDQEIITMELAFAPDSFDLSHLPGQTVSVASVLFWLVCLAAVGYYFFRLRSKRLRPSLRQTAFNESTAGEIPCELFGAMPDLFGILAHWGNLGYLVISRSRNGRILLRKQMEMGSERSAVERKLFYSLFRSSDTLDASDARVLSVSKRVGAMMQRSWLRRLFRKNSGSPILLRCMALTAAGIASLIVFDLLLPASWLRWVLLPLCAFLGAMAARFVQKAVLQLYGRRSRFCLLLGGISAVLLLILSVSAGCFVTMLVCIALQIFCGAATMFGGVRDAAAQDLVRQILGLRSFLKSANAVSLQRLTDADSQYFYRMLPFAEQLGVASAFARRCASVSSEPCPWLIDSLSKNRSTMDFYASYTQIAAAIRREPTLSLHAKTPEVIYG